MLLKDKSKKELSEIAKGLGLKFTNKTDKKVLINLIEEHNKNQVKKEFEQKELISTAMDSKDEKITIEGLKDIEDSRAEMTDQASDEKIHQLDINLALIDPNDNVSKNKSTMFESIKPKTENRYDSVSSSEGYKEKLSYNHL